MRLGEQQLDPAWEHNGRRTVGPYICDGGRWRRMDLQEAFTVCLDRDYNEMIYRPTWALLRCLAPGYNGTIDLTTDGKAA